MASISFAPGLHAFPPRQKSGEVLNFGDFIAAVLAKTHEVAKALLGKMQSEYLIPIAREVLRVAEETRAHLAKGELSDAVIAAAQCCVEEVSEKLLAELEEAWEPAEMQLCLTGDREAMGDFIERHHGVVMASAGAALHTARSKRMDLSATAEDLAQEFWTAFIREPRRFIGNYNPEKGPIAQWMSRTAYFCMNRLSAHRSLGIRNNVPIDADVDPETVPSRTGDKDGAFYELRHLQAALGSDAINKTALETFKAVHGIGIDNTPTTPKAFAEKNGVKRSAVYKRLEHVTSRVTKLLPGIRAKNQD